MDMTRSDRIRMIPIVADTLGREAQIAANTTALQLEQEGRLKTNNSASSGSNSAEIRVEKEATQEDGEWEKVEGKKKGKGNGEEQKKKAEEVRAQKKTETLKATATKNPSVATATGSTNVVEQAARGRLRKSEHDPEMKGEKMQNLTLSETKKTVIGSWNRGSSRENNGGKKREPEIVAERGRYEASPVRTGPVATDPRKVMMPVNTELDRTASSSCSGGTPTTAKECGSLKTTEAGSAEVGKSLKAEERQPLKRAEGESESLGPSAAKIVGIGKLRKADEKTERRKNRKQR